MRGVLGRIISLLAILICANAGQAQDLTLTSRDGALAIAGQLRSFDGEVYRIDSDYGLLTINAESVICEGPACPDLTAPKAVIRFVGDADAARALLPPVIAGFAKSKGLDLQIGVDGVSRLSKSDTVLAEISFLPMRPDAARKALAEARAEFIVSRFAVQGEVARILALDALVPIISPDNPTGRISTADLAKALAGDVANWQDLGGPNRPLIIHGLGPNSEIEQALAQRLGTAPAIAVEHPDLTSLAAAVARDPWALAMTGQALIGASLPLALTDSCGFLLQTSSFAVKAQDYPLTLPVYLVTPPRRLPLMAREFLDFLATPAADMAVDAAGYISRSLEQLPLVTDGVRLMNAINAAGKETTLADIQRLSLAMSGAERLSMSFRFDEGRDTLDPPSIESLNDLARRLEAGMFQGRQLTLIGFSDGKGDVVKNLDIATARARNVLASLSALTQDVELPKIDAFGEAMPMACDDTAAGQRLNRRVEIWVR